MLHNVHTGNYQTHPFSLRLFLKVTRIGIINFYLRFQLLIAIKTAKPAGSLCTSRFITPKFHILITQCIYVFLYGPQNKQRLFHYTALTDWFS